MDKHPKKETNNVIPYKLVSVNNNIQSFEDRRLRKKENWEKK
jgi:hypothetical protein